MDRFLIIGCVPVHHQQITQERSGKSRTLPERVGMICFVLVASFTQTTGFKTCFRSDWLFQRFGHLSKRRTMKHVTISTPRWECDSIKKRFRRSNRGRFYMTPPRAKTFELRQLFISHMFAKDGWSAGTLPNIRNALNKKSTRHSGPRIAANSYE